MFFEDIFRDAYFDWSAFVNKLFYSSTIIFSVVVIILLLLIFLIIRRKEFKIVYKIILGTILLLNLIFLIIIPFFKGSIINSYFEKGMIIVNNIEKYKIEKGNIPKSIYELSPYYENKEEFEKIKLSFKYYYFDHNELNRKYGYNRTEDQYDLFMKIHDISGPLYKYNERNKVFEFED